MAPTPARKLAGWRKSTLRPRSGTMAQRPTGKRANARVARVWNFRPSSPLKKDSAASLGETCYDSVPSERPQSSTESGAPHSRIRERAYDRARRGEREVTDPQTAHT